VVVLVLVLVLMLVVMFLPTAPQTPR
jgi:hypothetical protein